MLQVAPGARVVLGPRIWPLPLGPQVEKNRMTGKSAALVPDTVPCAIPVRGTFPVLVSVNAWQGPPPSKQARPAPTPRFAVGFQVVGVNVALITAATPFPLRTTGEPLTVTFAVMVRLPVTAPVAVGENTTLIVQVAP